MENTDATLFRKKSRGTAVKGSGTCCSSSLSIRGFDRYTSTLASPLKGRLHAVRRRLHRGCSVGPQRPIHRPGKCLSIVTANEERNVKWPYFTNGMLSCCCYCTFLKLIYSHVFHKFDKHLYTLSCFAVIPSSGNLNKPVLLTVYLKRKFVWGLEYHTIHQEAEIFVLGAGSPILLVWSHIRVLSD